MAASLNKPGAGIAAHTTSWQAVVLVCSKCSKKLDGGFGPDGDDRLARVLRQGLRNRGERRTTRVIETKCMGLCPKRAVAMLAGGHPGVLLAVPAGTPVDAVLARVLGG